MKAMAEYGRKLIPELSDYLKSDFDLMTIVTRACTIELIMIFS